MLNILLSLYIAFAPVMGIQPAPVRYVTGGVTNGELPVASGEPLEILGAAGPMCDPTSNTQGSTTFTTVTSGSALASAGTGLKNYIYSGQVNNTGNTNVLITWHDGSGGTILGYTAAPAGYGKSNIQYVAPMKTSAATALYAETNAASTTVYVTVQGCKQP